MPANPTILSYTIQDDSGAKASAAFYVDYDGAVITAQELLNEWTNFGDLVDGITDGKIVGGSVTIPLGRDGAWKAAAVADSFVGKTGVFNFANDTTFKRDGFAVPAIANAVVTAGRIVLTNAAVAAFTAAMTSGFTNGNFANAADQGLTALIDAFLSSRKHASVKQRSFETV